MIMDPRKTIIGVIHLPPLPGYPDAPGMDIALANALNDLRAFERGGVNAVILENNYDIPHTETVAASTVDAMMTVAHALRSATTMPIGICVLWNDYRAALTIAKNVGCQFVRVPVFVDTVRTDFGVIEGCAREAVAFRSAIGADHVDILADVHVKHAELLSDPDFRRCVASAIRSGADAVIVTGVWTGDPPRMEDVRDARASAGNAQVFVGSGIDASNVRDILSVADGAIVSTSLKHAGMPGEHAQNIVGWERRIDPRKVAALMEVLGRR